MRCILFLILLPFFACGQLPEITDVKVSFLFIDKDVDGTIEAKTVQSQLNLADFTKSSITGTAEVNTLDTDNFLRDGHLMWKKYFNEDDYPILKFESTSISKKSANIYAISTDLTIKGITKSIETEAQIEKNKVSITTIIYTSDWDINISKKRSENELEIQIDLYFK